MRQRLWFIECIVVVLTCALGVALVPAASPEGTLTVAVATFGNERWLPHQYVAAEDIVLKPMLENLLSRDLKTGSMSPMLAERWEVLDGGRTWKFHIPPNYVVTPISFHHTLDLSRCYPHDGLFVPIAISTEGDP